MPPRALRRFAGLLALVLCCSAHAVAFKWASQDDAATMDPDAFNHGPTMTVLGHIYEGLVRRDREQRIEPALAQSWTQPAPTVWRFRLREGVRFHDGSLLTAEDVVFSLKRAMTPESDMKVFAASIADVKAVDATTVDVVTEFPNAALLQSLPELKVMSKAWAEKNGALRPADMRQKSENFATRNTNGTGPFKLSVREPDVRTVLVAHTGWWDKPGTNITEATMVKISSAATRVAALLSGELDFAYPIPLQDIPRVEASTGYKVLQGPEIRNLFLSMDQASPELRYASVKGKNPFADRRVRLAIYQAIDIEAIGKRILRDSAVPTGILVPRGVNSVDAAMVARPFPYDLAAAKKLLAEAGYPTGFEVTLDCTNDRYVNDEQVCTAIAGMLSRIGVKVAVNALPGARFFTKVGAGDSSFNFFGYTPVNLDAYNTLNVMMATRDGKAGQWNVGRYSNPEVDRLIGQVLTEMDPQARTRLVTQAMTLHRNDVGHIPLYQQGLAWGMRKNVDAALQSDNRVNLRFISVR
ncbi:MAG: ABC transporter substrate-binding protein [Variovorax sp.]|jgi:peptide/nickel transport system substrate-binding protein|nr:ABC transporter substrate-binding protein [Variovorax sp.]